MCRFLKPRRDQTREDETKQFGAAVSEHCFCGCIHQCYAPLAANRQNRVRQRFDQGYDDCLRLASQFITALLPFVNIYEGGERTAIFPSSVLKGPTRMAYQRPS